MRRGAAVLLLLVIAGCVETTKPLPAASTCKIGEIVDGDTFVVTCQGSDVLARLSGVDAPEFGAAAACPTERAKGRDAREYLQELVALKPVTEVQFGAKVAGDQRQFAQVKLDGEDLASLMIAAGHARSTLGSTQTNWCSAG